MPDAAFPRTEAQADIVLRVDQLRKCYGANEVVRGLSFAIRRGECFGLLGPNGAGKTTTLRCCLGLIDPDGGTIEMVGEPVPKAARQARIRVGVVPQLDNLDPDFTVTENLQVYGRYFGIDKATLATRIPGLLEFAGLAGRKDARLRTLSGGTKRRLTLARALINDPDLLILDEPTASLDPVGRKEFRDILVELKRRGKTIFISSHILSEVESVCDRVAILQNGQLKRMGTLQELSAGKVTLFRFNGLPGPVIEALAAIGAEVSLAQGAATVRCRDEPMRQAVSDTLRQHGVDVGETEVETQSLEEIFLTTVNERAGT